MTERTMQERAEQLWRVLNEPGAHFKNQRQLTCEVCFEARIAQALSEVAAAARDDGKRAGLEQAMQLANAHRGHNSPDCGAEIFWELCRAVNAAEAKPAGAR